MPITISTIPTLRSIANTTPDTGQRQLMQDAITEVMVLREIVSHQDRKKLARYQFPAGRIVTMIADAERGPSATQPPPITAHFIALEGLPWVWDVTLGRLVNRDDPDVTSIDYALDTYEQAINAAIDADAWMRAAKPNGAGATRL